MSQKLVPELSKRHFCWYLVQIFRYEKKIEIVSCWFFYIPDVIIEISRASIINVGGRFKKKTTPSTHVYTNPSTRFALILTFEC